MRLHHVTSRGNCTSIAENGFRESSRSHATGVFLSPPGLLWVADGLKKLDQFAVLGEDAAVFAFDIPDGVASEFAVYEEVLEGDPVDAELPFEANAEGMVLYEYCVPAEVANRYCVGLVHWTGPEVLTPTQVTTILSRGRG